MDAPNLQDLWEEFNAINPNVRQHWREVYRQHRSPTIQQPEMISRIYRDFFDTVTDVNGGMTVGELWHAFYVAKTGVGPPDQQTIEEMWNQFYEDYQSSVTSSALTTPRNDNPTSPRISAEIPTQTSARDGQNELSFFDRVRNAFTGNNNDTTTTTTRVRTFVDFPPYLPFPPYRPPIWRRRVEITTTMPASTRRINYGELFGSLHTLRKKKPKYNGQYLCDPDDCDHLFDFDDEDDDCDDLFSVPSSSSLSSINFISDDDFCSSSDDGLAWRFSNHFN